MALKTRFKNLGKSIGGTAKSFGKAVATTAKVAVGKEKNEVGEDGKSTLKSSWSNVGHGFKDTGKAAGSAAKGTVKKVRGKEVPDEEPVTVEARDVKKDEEK